MSALELFEEYARLEPGISGNVGYDNILKSHIFLWVSNFKHSKTFKKYLPTFNIASVQVRTTLVGDWNAEGLILLVS